jgi:hypothetical protein
MDASNKESILAAIAHEEERLKKLTHEREQAMSRIQTLRNKLLSYEATGNVREFPAECFKTSLTPKKSKDSSFPQPVSRSRRCLSTPLD